MKIEELRELMGKVDSFTDEEFKETLRFFDEISEINCDLIDDFCNFYMIAIHTTNTYHRLEDIHKVSTKLYELSDKNCLSLWKLDLIQVYYYYFLDSLSQVLKHVNQILTSTVSNVDKSVAYSFAIRVFFKHKLYNQAITYIEEADIYLKNNATSNQNIFQLYMNELDVYSAANQPKKFLQIVDKTNELLNESITFNYYEQEQVFYKLHLLFGKVNLKEHFDLKDEALSLGFKEVLISLRKWGIIFENYGTLLTPLFEHFKNSFNSEEFVDEICNVLSYNMNVNEKVILFKYLFESVMIDKEKYHDIYYDYVKNLSYYYNNTQRNKASEILTEILNFSLEKKLDVLNAKYHYDTLTGCYNRVFLSEIEEKVLEAGDIVIYLDLNDFKKINDTYGHDAGDKQLKIFAEILMRHFENDVVLRLGGDEFVVITRGLPESVLAKLDEARAEYLTHNLLKNRYGFSAGVLIPHGMVLHEAIGEADKAMYDSKKTGLPCIIREV